MTSSVRSRSSEHSTDALAAFAQDHKVNQEICGTVRRVYPYGVFVEISPCVQGLVHRSQILPGKVVEPERELWPGDHVRALITGINWSKRQISLSIAEYLVHASKKVQSTIEGYIANPSNTPQQKAVRQDDNESYNLEQEIEKLYQGLTVKPERIRQIVLLEDADELRESTCELLEFAGYRVIAPKEIGDLNEFLVNQPADLYLIDAHMQKMDGLFIARKVVEKYPTAAIILMSGLSLNQEESHALKQLKGHFLQKPYAPEQLDATLMDLETSVALASKPDITISEPVERIVLSTKPADTPIDHTSGVEQILHGLVMDTKAESGAVFSMDLVTHEVYLFASANISTDAYKQWRHNLDLSPVKDVILEREPVFNKDAIYQGAGKFRYLLTLLEFSSCIGIPLTHAGKIGYALFLFYSLSASFDESSIERVWHAARAIDALIERNLIQIALEKAQIFTSLGEISAGLAHEVNNRVGALLPEIKLLQSYNRRLLQTWNESGDLSPDFIKKHLDNIARITTTVDHLKKTAYLFQQLVSPRQGNYCDPAIVIQKAVSALFPYARKHHVDIVVEPVDELPTVTIKDVALEQILINLVLNAVQNLLDSHHPYGCVRVHASHDRSGENPLVIIDVIDNGTGIHHKYWESIFDLGFSTRPNGSGLGLFITKALVTSYGGLVQVQDSIMFVGTTFRITLVCYSQ
jgi:signal transduction histidine kinase/predicted RNA-binding protein with RPS1 domain